MSSPNNVRILLLLLAATPCHFSHATGDFEGPATMLDDGGKQVTGTPEFFWELECKRIAGEFVPVENRVILPVTAPDASKPAAEDAPPNPRGDFTTAMDLADFRAAIKDGSLKPADPGAATGAHGDARNVLIDSSATRAGRQTAGRGARRVRRIPQGRVRLQNPASRPGPRHLGSPARQARRPTQIPLDLGRLHARPM